MIVGAFVRIDPRRRLVIRSQLRAIAGVDTFDLREPGTIGLLVEREALHAAHGVLRDIVPLVDGVMGVWPVYVDTDGHAP